MAYYHSYVICHCGRQYVVPKTGPELLCPCGLIFQRFAPTRAAVGAQLCNHRSVICNENVICLQDTRMAHNCQLDAGQSTSITQSTLDASTIPIRRANGSGTTNSGYGVFVHAKAPEPATPPNYRLRTAAKAALAQFKAGNLYGNARDLLEQALNDQENS